jgi:hypothetical protein
MTNNQQNYVTFCERFDNNNNVMYICVGVVQGS